MGWAGLLSNFFKSHKQLLSELSIREDFFDRLKEDDDWSLVIKIYSLMEIAFTHLLIEHFGESLGNIFKKLEMGHKQYGKITFIRKLELINKRHVDFVERLGDMRNVFAHDIRNIEMGINGFFKNLKSNDREKYNQWLWIFGEDDLPESVTLKDTGKKITREKFLITMAKYNIITMAVSVLNEIYDKKHGMRSEREITSAKIKLAEELLKNSK